MTQENGQPATPSDLVANEIRALLAGRRLTHQWLAEALGVSKSWVSYRLTGKQAIDINDMHRVADALGVDVLRLFPSPDAASSAAFPTQQPTTTDPRSPDPGHRPNPRSTTRAGHRRKTSGNVKAA